MFLIKNNNNNFLNKVIATFAFLISSIFFSFSASAADQTVEMLNKLGKENMVYSKKIIKVDIGDTVFWKSTKPGHNVEFIKGGVPEGVEKFKSKYNQDVEFISDNHLKFIKDLKNKNGKDIWLIGGGQINTMLLNEGLIDELHLFCMPIILMDGVELFEGLPNRKDIELIETKAHDNGAIEMKYKIIN